MSNCLNCTCKCIPERDDDSQPDRVDHAAHARRLMDLAGEGYVAHEDWTETTALMATLDAQTHATLALADQQEVANLIAFLDHVDGEQHEALTGALKMLLGIDALKGR